MKINKAYLLLFIPAVAAISSVVKIWPVLPAVMRDEYIYSVQSRFTPFAEQLFPNYLFSWLYSGTSFCGPGFYGCGKALNAFFFFATLAFIFLIARMLLGIFWGIVIATVAALSPIHVYVSYFMPESMYFAFITATIYVSLIAGTKGRTQWWIASGTLLGLSALVKPHALFLLPAFVLFAFLVSLRRDEGNFRKGLTESVATLAAFAAIKFGVGFAFAGVSGLSLIGRAYQSALNQFVSAGPESSAEVENSGASNADFFSVFIPHTFVHLAVLLTVAGLPLILSIIVLKDSFLRKEELSGARQYLLLISMCAISLAVVFGAFEGVVTLLGDNHSERIITRYYEFLVPLLFIAAAVFAKFIEPVLPGRIVQSLILIISLILGATYLSGVDQSFADSILLSGYLSSPTVIPIVATVGVTVAVVWMFNSVAGSKLVVYVATPLILLIAGFAAQGHLLTQVGTTAAYFDIAGQKAKLLLSDVAGDKISIVGPLSYQNYTTKFWIDKPSIGDFVLPEGKAVKVDALANAEYVVLLGNSELAGEAETLELGDGYKILRIIR